MTIAIRRAGVGDSHAAAELWLRARKAAVGAIPPHVHTDDDARGWFRSHVIHECELWVAQEGSGRLVGILVLDGEWVDQLYVDPEQTGRGVGGRLLTVAKRERPGGLRLWTFVSNAGAQRFYERHGFVEVDRTDGCRNEEGAPDILYVWPPPGYPVATRRLRGRAASRPPDFVGSSLLLFDGG
jgi:GNAT superfamily N-acetyltransferase